MALLKQNCALKQTIKVHRSIPWGKFFMTVMPQCVYQMKFRKCLLSQEATGTAWIGLQQNIIDTAVNEWRKRLLACVRIVGQNFEQFYRRQLKNGQLDELSAKMSEM